MAYTNAQSGPKPRKAIKHMVDAARTEGQPDHYEGKRRHTRYATGMRLEMTLDPKVESAALPVVMHNVSEGGFAFWYRRNLPARTVVYLREANGRTPGDWLPAVVCHCTRGLLGYLVGAEFDLGDTDPDDQSDNPKNRSIDSKAEHLRRLVRQQLAAKRR